MSITGSPVSCWRDRLAAGLSCDVFAPTEAASTGVLEQVAEKILLELQALGRGSLVLRVADLEDDLAGLVGCALKHFLGLAGL